MTNLQVSLAAMFGLTAAAAGAVVVFQHLGVFWLLIIAAVVLFFRIPTWDGANPVAQAVCYTLIALALTSSLSYFLRVPAFQAMVPCLVLPAFAYIVGFFKGMENA